MNADRARTGAAPAVVPDFAFEPPAGPGSLRLVVMLRSTGSSTAVDAAVRAFLTACRLGAFPRPGSGPTALIADDTATRIEGRMLEYTCSTDGFDPAALRALLRMLNQVQQRGSGVEPIEHVSLASLPPLARFDALGALEQYPWPAANQAVPFQTLLHSRREFAGDSLVRIELLPACEPGVFTRLQATLMAWDALVVRGAFSVEPFDPEMPDDPVAAESGQQTYEAAPQIIEHLLYEPPGSSAADAALVNMIAQVDRARPCIACLEIV